jgi:hypothetical protein
LIGLLAWAAGAWPQRPSEPDAQAAIEKTRQKALDYARSLPDFVCTEVIHRYVDPRQRGNWIPTDKLTIKLSFFQQMEDHKLMLIDDKPTGRKFESLEGATGEGEFGGTLHSIFDPTSEATFHWESWKTVRKHRVAVYSYVVDVANSHYQMVTGVPGNSRQAIVGFHGVLDIDGESGAVLHFTYQADRIPKPLQLDFALTTVDYDFADVGGRDYLLPARSETEMRGPAMSVRNQMEFREYRKFSSESTVTFGDGK